MQSGILSDTLWLNGSICCWQTRWLISCRQSSSGGELAHCLKVLSQPGMMWPRAWCSRWRMEILVLFHSNADCEQIFSFVTKMKTAFYMSTKALSSLLIHKVSINVKEHSHAFLATAKSATYQNLKTNKVNKWL